MKICIFGAGAIGGLIAAKLAAAGVAETSLIARGPHLEAIRANGLRLLVGDTETTVNIPATADAAELGAQDYVILALKAHSVPQALDRLRPLLGPDTAVVTAQNGIPWWYFYGSGGPFEGRRIEAVDPGGRIWDAIGPERAIGAVVYPAAEVAAPGVIRHEDGDRFSLGEPSGGRSERVTVLSQALAAAGFRAPVRTQIRNEIWVKLWGNVSFNPISALTGGTLERDRRRSRHPCGHARHDGRGGARSAWRSGSTSRSTSTVASPGPRRSAPTRPRCCRTSSAAGRWRSTPWSRPSRSWAASSASRRRPSTPCWPWSASARASPAAIDGPMDVVNGKSIRSRNFSLAAAE